MKDSHLNYENDVEVSVPGTSRPEPDEASKSRKARQEQNGYAVMLLASAMVGGYPSSPRTNRVVNWARNFCILFAFAVPNLLLIRTVF